MSVLDDLHYYIEETRDPRTVTWPLTSGYTLFTIFFCYLYFIFVCGPRYMKDKPAYSLKTIIRCYNIFQIVANAMLLKTFLELDWVNETLNICSPITYSTDPRTMKMVSAIWWTLPLKIIDLIETMFFLLRKKNRQISFLHVHHHLMVIFLCWLSVRYAPGGVATFSILLNSGVHVIMYTYYFLSSLNPTIQKMISPYKPIITVVQMVQLFVIISYILMSFIPNCVFPRTLSIIGVINIAMTLYFFGDFYRKTYSKPTKKN